MRRLLFLLAGITLYATSSFSYTTGFLYDYSMPYGATPQDFTEELYAAINLGRTVVQLTVSVDAWNQSNQYNDDSKTCAWIKAHTNGGTITKTGDGDASGSGTWLENPTGGSGHHSAGAVWTAQSGYHFIDCYIKQYNKSTGNSTGLVWARVDYLY